MSTQGDSMASGHGQVLGKSRWQRPSGGRKALSVMVTGAMLSVLLGIAPAQAQSGDPAPDVIETCDGDAGTACSEGIPTFYELNDCTIIWSNSELAVPPTISGSPVNGAYSYFPGGTGTYEIAFVQTANADANELALAESAESVLGGVYTSWVGPETWELDAGLSFTNVGGPAIAEQIQIFANVGTLPGDTAVNPAFGSAFGTYTFNWVGGAGDAFVDDPAGQIVEGGGPIANGASITQTAGDKTTGAWSNSLLEWSVLSPAGATELNIFAQGGKAFEGFRFLLTNKQASCASVEKTETTLDLGVDGFANVGDTVTYEFTATNYGSTDLTNIVINDPKSPTGVACTMPDLAGNGDPAILATDTCTYVHVLTAADIAEIKATGGVTNQASIIAEDPFGNSIEDLTDDPNDPTDAGAADGSPDDPTFVALALAPELADDESLDNPPGTDVTLNILGNDTNGSTIDPDTVALIDPATGAPLAPGAPLVVPGEGTWTFDPATGELTFSPEPGFLGDPTPITYEAEDGNGNLAEPAEVVVTYLPEATDDESLDNTPGSTVTVDVIGNDSDDLDPSTVAIDDPNYDPATGTLVVPGEGTWTVDPTTGAISFEPEPGFVGDPTPISYTVEDADGNVATADVVVTYLPEILDDESLDNPPGSQVEVPLLANDTADIDPATIAFIDPATGLPLNAGQNLVVPGEGAWQVNQTTAIAFFTPEPGFQGDPTPVDYTANDVDGNPAVEPATITVTYLPVATDDESLGNPAGSTVTIDVLANDPTLDLDPSTVAIDDPNYDPATGTLVVPGEGTWTVDPTTGTITFEPEAGFLGDPTPISYTVEDTDGNVATADVVVTYAPLLEPDVDMGNIAGTPVTIDILGNDPSADIDPASVALIDPATGLPLAPGAPLVVPGEGEWTIDPTTGAMTFTPEPGFPGDPAPVEYTASDNDGHPAEPTTVTVGYLPVEPVPSDENLDNEPGTPVVVDILANDGNVDPTSVQLIDPATGNPVSELVVPGEGTWIIDPVTGALTFTPELGFVADPTPVSYTVTNENGITVGAEAVVSYLPVATDDESLDNPAGSTVTVDVLGNDPTLDLDPSTVAIDDPNYGPSTGAFVVPGEGTWTVDPATGVISFEPEAGFLGDPTPISYTVEDADGNEVSAEVVITYLDPEVVAHGESIGNTPGTAVTLDVVGSDGDVDPTSVQIIDPDTGLPVTELVVPGEGVWTVDPVTGALTFTPEAGFEGDPTPVDYIVTSVAGETLTATATITYLDPVAPTQAPTAAPALAFTGVESWQLALVAALILISGFGMTQVARRREDELNVID